MGANGAGKTSLLRACAGLLPVTSGDATVLGVDLTTDHTSVRRYVGLLGHAAPLYDELSAAENVQFAVRALGLPAKSADGALERLGLTGRLRTTPPAGCRPGSGDGSPSPHCWHAVPRSGCSTNHMPASTPHRARSWAS